MQMTKSNSDTYAENSARDWSAMVRWFSPNMQHTVTEGIAFTRRGAFPDFEKPDILAMAMSWETREDDGQMAEL